MGRIEALLGQHREPRPCPDGQGGGGLFALGTVGTDVSIVSIPELSFERGVDHALMDELDMACLKLGYAFKLAVTTGVRMDKAEADLLYARLVDALGQKRNGAA
jgi:hypothetical protein